MMVRWEKRVDKETELKIVPKVLKYPSFLLIPEKARD